MGSNNIFHMFSKQSFSSMLFTVMCTFTPVLIKVDCISCNIYNNKKNLTMLVWIACLEEDIGFKTFD